MAATEKYWTTFDWEWARTDMRRLLATDWCNELMKPRRRRQNYRTADLREFNDEVFTFPARVGILILFTVTDQLSRAGGYAYREFSQNTREHILFTNFSPWVHENLRPCAMWVCSFLTWILSPAWSNYPTKSSSSIMTGATSYYFLFSRIYAVF